MAILVLMSFLLMQQEVTSQMTCGPKVSPRMFMDVPCDLSKDSYCQVPGSAYPFSSVRRYIYENQGLMRRMYGDQRQSFVLRNEIDDIREKYDSINFFDPPPHKSFQRPAFGPRSMDSPSFHYVTKETEVPSSAHSSTASDAPTTFAPLASATVPTATLSFNTTALLQEPVSPGEPDDNPSTTSESSSLSPSESSATPASTSGAAAPDGDPLRGSESEPKKGVNACPVKEEVIAPFWANNTRGETLALLNVYPFEQYVHWEKCSFEFNQMFCRDGCRCEQQYRLHRLLAFDPKNDCRGVFADWFRFPSCCICVCYDIPENPLLYRVSRRKARL